MSRLRVRARNFFSLPVFVLFFCFGICSCSCSRSRSCSCLRFRSRSLICFGSRFRFCVRVLVHCTGAWTFALRVSAPVAIRCGCGFDGSARTHFGRCRLGRCVSASGMLLLFHWIFSIFFSFFLFFSGLSCLTERLHCSNILFFSLVTFLFLLVLLHSLAV